MKKRYVGAWVFGTLSFLLSVYTIRDMWLFLLKIDIMPETYGVKGTGYLGGVLILLTFYFLQLSYGIWTKKNYIIQYVFFYPLFVAFALAYNFIFAPIVYTALLGSQPEFVYFRWNREIGFAVDVICSVAFLIYFTRTKVKERFDK